MANSQGRRTLADWTVLAACIAAAAALVAGHRGYTLDDTYIYLQFARNVLNGHGMSFNAGEAVYGFTSPLWLWLITALGYCGLDLLVASKLLGALSTILAIAVFHLAALRWIPSRSIAWGATLVWATNAWLVRWALCGVEAPLAAAACIGVLHVYAVERGEGRMRFTPLLAGIAVLVRPECGLLLGVIVIDQLLRPRMRIAEIARTVGIAALVVLPWLAVAFTTFHTIIPTTLAAKSEAHINVADTIAAFIKAGTILGSTSIIEALCFGALLVPAVRKRITALPRVFWLWPLLLVAAYTITNAVVLSRYVLVAIPAVILAGWMIVDAVTQGMKHARAIALAVIFLVLAQNQYVIWSTVKPHVQSFTETVDNTLIPIALRLRSETPTNAVVATPDIGAIGYFSGRRIVDLGGLITPRIRLEFPGATYDEIVQQGLYQGMEPVDVLVDRNEKPARLNGLDTLATWHAPSLGIVTKEGGVYYTVYRIKNVRIP